MAITLGRNFLISVLVAGGEYAVVAGQKSGTISLTMDSVETTTKVGSLAEAGTDPLAKQYLGAIYGWEVTLNGAYDLTDTGTLADYLINGTPVKVECCVGADLLNDTGEGSSSTNPHYFSGDGIVTSFSSTGDQGDLTTYDITIQGTGAIGDTTIDT